MPDVAFAQPRVIADVIPRVRAGTAALVGGSALLTAVCAQISIPIPGDPVPITGQTFAVLLTGAALGARRGALGQLLYVGLGVMGLPFYADGESGPSVLFGATGGYLLGFILAAWVVGRLAEARLDRSPLKALPLFTIGSLLIFAIGVPWLAVSADLSVLRAVELGFVPFVPGGIVKALVAAGLLPVAWRLVDRQGRQRQ
jgi:biotin transport system substrate-specific component